MNAITLAVIAISILTANSIAGCQATARCHAGDPILLVPGMTGSQLKVKHSGFILCNTLGKFAGLWVNELRASIAHGCFSSELKVNSNAKTGQKNIKVQVPGFGDTSTVEQLSQGRLMDISYYRTLVEYFVKRGYKRGVSIRAAPYDWRLGPEELKRGGYYDDLKKLTEAMYSENGNTKVTLVIHSMGGPITLYFLTSGIVNQAWKDKYIGNYVTLSAAWAGGNEVVQYQISGISPVNEKSDDLFYLIGLISKYVRKSLKPVVRSFPSISLVTPNPLIWGNTVLIKTPTQSYTANDYQALFNDINYPEGYDKFKGVQGINKNWPAPNVPTHCYYGVGVDTPVSFHYGKPFPEGASDAPDQITMGDGDGTIPLLSLKVCLRWKNHNGGHPFEDMEFHDVDHHKIISDNDILKNIGSIVGTSLHVDPKSPCPIKTSRK